MKRSLAFLITAIMLIWTVSCASTGKGPLDLTGNWEETAGGDTYMSAYIQDGAIEVYQMTAGNKALYWAGTYDPPKDNAGKYSWISVNDKVKTGSSDLGSSGDTMEFSYSDGTLSFEMTKGTENVTVSLGRTDTDYSEGFIPSVSGTLADKGSPEVVDFGYTVIEGGYNIISYGAVIRNPSPDLAMTRPVVTITAKAEKGYVIHEYQIAIAPIAAGDTIFFAQDIQYQGPLPAAVEITVTNGETDFSYQAPDDPIYLRDLEVKDVYASVRDGLTVFKGDITNKTRKYIQNAMLVAVFFDKDGRILGGTLGSVSDLDPGETVSFEVTDYMSDLDGSIEYSSFQIYGLEW